MEPPLQSMRVPQGEEHMGHGEREKVMSMGDIPEGAILQRDGKTYAVITRTPAGLITPGHLEKVAAVARKHAVPTLKITSGQRIALVGIPGEKLGTVYRDLGKDADSTGGPCLHYVRACPGTETCRFGVQDSMGLAAVLEERFLGKAFPAKLKMGISGCPRCCAESHTRDIGILGTNRGWTVIFGGNGGTRPRIEDVIAEDLSTARPSNSWNVSSGIIAATRGRGSVRPGSWSVPAWTRLRLISSNISRTSLSGR
jgi:NAD(P)H-nitrite reductase large subunit